MRSRGKRVTTLAALAAVVLVSGGWILQASGVSPTFGRGLFEIVRTNVARNFVEPVDSDELYEMAIRGLLQEIGDPYAAFIQPDEQRSALLTNNYGGVGMRVLADQIGRAHV